LLYLIIGGIDVFSSTGYSSSLFLVTSCLLAADFWYTKNVAGRLLVGLRWWTKFKEDGTEEWIYETK